MKVKIKFNAPAHHSFVCGDLRIMGGETAQVEESDAELLARDPQIEILGRRAKTDDDTEPAKPDTKKEAA